MIVFYLSIGILAGLFLSPLATYIHELGHYLCVAFLSRKTPAFTDKVSSKIVMNKERCIFFREGFTKSNYLKFLSDHQPSYAAQIAKIAIAGVRFSSILYVAAISISLILAFGFSKKVLMITGTFAFFLFRELLSYLTSKHTQSDKNIYNNPEQYVYPYDD